MSFVSTDSADAKTTTWLTPLDLIMKLGTFELDPCGHHGHRTAERLIVLPDDGLKQTWSGRVWLNPPYGKEQQAWLAKLQAHGQGTALIFNRLDTAWIQPYIAKGFFALQGRISFLNADFKKQANAGVGSILIPFGPRDTRLLLSSDLKGRWFS